MPQLQKLRSVARGQAAANLVTNASTSASVMTISLLDVE
jgi:hypothetical protein